MIPKILMEPIFWFIVVVAVEASIFVKRKLTFKSTWEFVNVGIGFILGMVFWAGLISYFVYQVFSIFTEFLVAAVPMLEGQEKITTSIALFIFNLPFYKYLIENKSKNKVKPMDDVFATIFKQFANTYLFLIVLGVALVIYIIWVQFTNF